MLGGMLSACHCFGSFFLTKLRIQTHSAFVVKKEMLYPIAGLEAIEKSRLIGARESSRNSGEPPGAAMAGDQPVAVYRRWLFAASKSNLGCLPVTGKQAAPNYETESK